MLDFQSKRLYLSQVAQFLYQDYMKGTKKSPKKLVCIAFYVLLYFNSKTLLKHLPNTFYFSSCQKHVQSNKNNAVGGNIFYYFKRVNDRCIK